MIGLRKKFLALAALVLLGISVREQIPDRMREIPEQILSFAEQALLKKPEGKEEPEEKPGTASFSLEQLPAYSGRPYVEVHGNVPFFTEEDLTEEPFEYYSELDGLGRCGVAFANICRELMPEEERGPIGQVKPSGWHTVKYPDVIQDLYLYNRCHLIGYQLSGENANERNLIMGTRYLNLEGMLPFENETARYVKETGNHVLYRVTPVFEGDHLVASGVLMEAESVEDGGKGLSFCIYAYNVQPGIVIDYATGESALAENQGDGGLMIFEIMEPAQSGK